MNNDQLKTAIDQAFEHTRLASPAFERSKAKTHLERLRRVQQERSAAEVSGEAGHFEENKRLQARVSQLEKSARDLSAMFNDKIVGEQAAYIEWKHGRGANAGMKWIANGLWGPGLIPDDDEPWGKDAQAYFSANKSDPFPVCPCGRPSSQLWMGRGACCREHMADIKRAEADAEGDTNED